MEKIDLPISWSYKVSNSELQGLNFRFFFNGFVVHHQESQLLAFALVSHNELLITFEIQCMCSFLNWSLTCVNSL